MMKTLKTNNILEYLSPTLILSYFIVHNIYLVIIGISFSFYLININSFQTILRKLFKTSTIEESSKDIHSDDKELNTDKFHTKSSEIETDIALVEIIEELGFIPSLDKDSNNKAA